MQGHTFLILTCMMVLQKPVMFRKARGICYQMRHVTKRDMLLNKTCCLHFLIKPFQKMFIINNIFPMIFSPKVFYYPNKFKLFLFLCWDSFLLAKIFTTNLCIKWAGLEF